MIFVVSLVSVPVTYKGEAALVPDGGQGEERSTD